MCYIAGNSDVLNLVFDNSAGWDNFLEQIPNNGWFSDQLYVYNCIQKYGTNKVKFPYRSFNNDRIDRINWKYDDNLVIDGFYIDSHLLRPYKLYKNDIEKLISLI
jgi:hypothetical protein